MPSPWICCTRTRGAPDLRFKPAKAEGSGRWQLGNNAPVTVIPAPQDRQLDRRRGNHPRHPRSCRQRRLCRLPRAANPGGGRGRRQRAARQRHDPRRHPLSAHPGPAGRAWGEGRDAGKQRDREDRCRVYVYVAAVVWGVTAKQYRHPGLDPGFGCFLRRVGLREWSTMEIFEKY
jgi:hypothetical protein